MSLKTLHVHILLVLATIITFFSGCDRSINPFEDDQGIYSVYGALEVGKSQNIIRVRDLTVPFNRDSSFNFNATVTFTDLQTGESKQLRDTVVVFSGNKTHNFILEDDLALDKQYRLTVERPDGASVSSTATTPGLTDAHFFPGGPNGCERKIDFQFRNVKRDEIIKMEIGAVYQGDLHWGELDLVGDVEYDSDRDIFSAYLSPRNLLVEVFTPQLPDNPYFDPLMLFPTVNCDELDNPELLIRYKHFGPEWSEGLTSKFGLIDTESGVVENGLGFFGAYRVDTFTIPLSIEEPQDF